MTGLASPPGHVRPVTPLGIAAAQLERLVSRADAGDTGGDFASELRQVAGLVAGLDGYVERCSTPESPVLARLAAATADHDWRDRAGDVVFLEQEMLSGHLEGQLLKTLVRASHARRVLEIGMFTGYSALAVAEALPADGVVVACEIDAQVADFAQRMFAASPAGARIDVRVAPADETLRALGGAGETFDLVFLDADKAGYAGYVDAVLDNGLLAEHGLLCVDNTLLQGQPWADQSGGEISANGRAIADFNARLAADPRVEQLIVPLRDGVTLAYRTDTHERDR